MLKLDCVDMMYLNINVTRKCKFETETNKTKKENRLDEILPLLIKLFQLFVFESDLPKGINLIT